MALEDQLVVRVPTLSEGTNFKSSSHPTEERNSPQNRPDLPSNRCERVGC
jgi:hypothetical protein